ncbi:MAG TPA: hypothetical protein VH277_06910, partial [Gemmatimonadaceae bacterium]|nr:hypothetical protein [Gemmatimonadaceae bacterium]
YMVTADLATLEYAAKFKNELLYNRYQSARNTIAQFKTSAPYAYIIPQEQRDPVAPMELLRRMAFMGVRVNQLDRDVAYNGTTYPKGTWVIPMDQEFAQLVRELFEPQKYPDLGEDTPYDAAGWTLPYQMGINVIEATTPLTDELRSAMKSVQGKAVDWHTNADEPFTTSAAAAGIVAPAGGISGTGSVLVLDPAQNNSFRFINRALVAGGSVRYAQGKYVVSGVDRTQANAWANELFVRATSLDTAPANAVAAPTRIAIYKSAPGVMDEGWTEWLLDTFGFKYNLITPTDVRAGDLGSRFDAILIGSQSIGATGGRGGRGGGGGERGGRGNPAADSAAAEGVRSLDEFVKGGGTVIAWNQGATSVANALRLPVRNVVGGVERKNFYTGGSIMSVVTDTTQAVMAGMPGRADVFVFNSPVFTTLDGFDGSVLARFASDVSPLRSGFLNGTQYIQGFAAALDVKHERGHAVLFAFQPEWRGQPQGTFRTVFNALFFARDVADQAKPTPGFWTAPAFPVTPAAKDSAGGRGTRPPS